MSIYTTIKLKNRQVSEIFILKLYILEVLLSFHMQGKPFPFNYLISKISHLKYSCAYMAHLGFYIFLRWSDTFFFRIITCRDMRGKNLLKMPQSPQPYNYFSRVLIIMKTKGCILTSLHNWLEPCFRTKDDRTVLGVENKHEEISLTDLIIPFLLVILSTHPQIYTQFKIIQLYSMIFL